MTYEEYRLQNKKKIIKFFAEKDYRSINFIGIDRSLTSTGIAVVRNGALKYQGLIKSREYDVQRLIDIGKQCIQKIKDYSNPLIMMESYSYDRPFQAHQLGECGGVLKSFFTLKQIQYLELTPHELKKYVSGKGNVSKDLIPMHVLKKFKIESVNNDAADAIGCAYFVYNIFRYMDGENDYKEYEKEVFKSYISCAPKKKKSKKKSTNQLAMEIDE